MKLSSKAIAKIETADEGARYVIETDGAWPYYDGETVTHSRFGGHRKVTLSQFLENAVRARRKAARLLEAADAMDRKLEEYIQGHPELKDEK